ncbi:MAG TPA: RES family NAD+ phosphorylase [Thermoanaerobaculia bacterium]|nr:RES family NAD+ phosphorylase [Thermoanaerobaculia bacterium]
MITAWRIVRPEYGDDAFSGEGALLYGGRWNSPGHGMVYTCESIALATLEVLAWLNPKRLCDFVVVSCLFAEKYVETLDRSLLPRDWRTYPAPVEVQRIGDAWLKRRSSAVLAVPSAIIEQETNYLLNPEHDDFGWIDQGSPQPFSLDPRLVT